MDTEIRIFRATGPNELYMEFHKQELEICHLFALLCYEWTLLPKKILLLPFYF